ncbi:MAG: protein-L-isoaspartate O-methyltransferase [gamma proteobacterium symbiont of Bathyaustriella thionipta]|nr:protein-L-isoaspartate O-methyltransferase [gamma proteobacterium symbiont of Bathyaustriella thionipta]
MNVEQARTNMLQQQLRPWDVADERVLRVMQDIPREDFVPQAYRQLAFSDSPIPLVHGGSMMEPRLQGRLLQALSIRPSDKVLEIGTGSGFLSACLARLAAKVISVDPSQENLQEARERLNSLDIRNVELHQLDALQQDVDDAPFDVIAINGSLPVYDERFQNWLTTGGRLFIIVGEGDAMEARLITRVSNTHWLCESMFETSVTALNGAPHPTAFQF